MSLNLTVGQVSGIIAAGVVVVKLALPTLCAFLFVGTVRERNDVTTTSAISWSSIGRLLHSSYWPTILGSDSAALSGVPFHVLLFRYASILGTMLLSIAAIVTPLGLHETTVPGRPIPEQFYPMHDEGIFGRGTPTRNESVSWSRTCGGNAEPFTCPDLTRAPPSNNRSIDRGIPQETVDLFTGGLSATSSSVSSIFDIQWRSWSWTRLLANGQSSVRNFSLPSHPSYNERYPIGIYRPISTLILEDGYSVIEGLVVDTLNGGVGFRNHSTPAPTAYGSTWSEDLLFIQPVSSCVDTNITLDYSIPENDVRSLNSRSPMVVTDRGGFSGLNTTYPEWDVAGMQTDPQLKQRAYQAAWLSNVFAMAKFNVSNVTLGRDPDRPLILDQGHSVEGNLTFPISQATPHSCSIDLQNAATISPDGFGCYAANNSGGVPEDGTFEAAPRLIKDICEGGDWESSRGTIGNIASYCALVLGASIRTDGQNEWSFDTADSAWSKPMYSCAMAVEATIKSVTFSYNRTNGQSELAVIRITDKTYQSEAEYPVWGVENLSLIGRFWMMPLWGLVSPEVAAQYPRDQLKTVQKPSLFLPRITTLRRSISLIMESGQNLPGAEFADNGLGAVSDMAYRSLARMDYTGAGNLALAQRWTTLSRSAESMTRALNLVWTDYAANAVVGTKGSPGPGPGNEVFRPVSTHQNSIRYQLRYAVPAIVALAMLVLVTFLVFVALLLGRTSLAKMKRYLNATSAGRIMVSVLPQPPAAVRTVDNDTPTGEWLEREGQTQTTTGKILQVPGRLSDLGKPVGQEP